MSINFYNGYVVRWALVKRINPMLRIVVSLGCVIFLIVISVACRTQDTAQSKIESPTPSVSPTPTRTSIPNPIAKSTPISDDVEMVILHQIASQWCTTAPQLGLPRFSVEENRYSFGCAISAGHSVSATIHRFPSSPEAHAAFGDGEALFHCFPAHQEETGDYPYRQRRYEWQAERWLVQISASDDTRFGANLERVSEEIYRLARIHNLFSEC